MFGEDCLLCFCIQTGYWSGIILKRQSPKSCQPTESLLILHQDNRKWAERAETSLAQRFRFFRSGLPRILYCNQCAPAAHESCPTCAAFSDIIGSGWILALLPMLVVPMGGLACTKDTTDAHGREHMRIYSNSYGDVLDVWCLHGTCIWELLACRDFGVPRRCRKDCTVESCRTWLVKGCPQCECAQYGKNCWEHKRCFFFHLGSDLTGCPAPHPILRSLQCQNIPALKNPFVVTSYTLMNFNEFFSSTVNCIIDIGIGVIMTHLVEPSHWSFESFRFSCLLDWRRNPKNGAAGIRREGCWRSATGLKCESIEDVVQIGSSHRFYQHWKFGDEIIELVGGLWLGRFSQLS